MRDPAVSTSLALLLATLAACGGSVVFDGLGAGGADGAGGAGSTTTSTTGVTATTGSLTTGSSVTTGGQGGAGCGLPPPVGALQSCSAVAATGGPGQESCYSSFCDAASNLFDASCQGGSCTCSFMSADGTKKSQCSCANSQTCTVLDANCCNFQ